MPFIETLVRGKAAIRVAQMLFSEHAGGVTSFRQHLGQGDLPGGDALPYTSGWPLWTLPGTNPIVAIGSARLTYYQANIFCFKNSITSGQYSDRTSKKSV
jgi:hypothetical protein